MPLLVHCLNKSQSHDKNLSQGLTPIRKISRSKYCPIYSRNGHAKDITSTSSNNHNYNLKKKKKKIAQKHGHPTTNPSPTIFHPPPSPTNLHPPRPHRPNPQRPLPAPEPAPPHRRRRRLGRALELACEKARGGLETAWRIGARSGRLGEGGGECCHVCLSRDLRLLVVFSRMCADVVGTGMGEIINSSSGSCGKKTNRASRKYCP